MGGLVRYVVFFVMKLKTRAVENAGITSQPDEVWMTQLARNLTDAGDGFLREVQYVILDRDRVQHKVGGQAACARNCGYHRRNTSSNS